MSSYIISVMLKKTHNGVVTFSQALHGRKGEGLHLDHAIGSAVQEAMKMKPGFGIVSILWMNADDFDDRGVAAGVATDERGQP